MGNWRKIAYGIIGCVVIGTVVCGKVPAIGKRFTDEAAGARQLADLYRLCEVERFQQEIPIVPSAPTTPLERADILTMGDSFFNFSLESDLVANLLAARGGYSVHNIPITDTFEPCSYPLVYLRSIDYRPDRRRVLILETVERNSLERIGKYLSMAGKPAGRMRTMASRILDNSDLEYFVTHNRLVQPLNRRLKTIRFEYFATIDTSIGAYSVDPNMLFFHPDMEFAAVAKNEPRLDEAAARVARLAEMLRRKYDIDLIYVVVPDKYSIYRDLSGTGVSYDGFIPRLVDKLRRRGVRAVDMYSVYMDFRKISAEALYYASDTHFTPRGKQILVDECLKEIRSMAGSGRSLSEKAFSSGTGSK